MNLCVGVRVLALLQSFFIQLKSVMRSTAFSAFRIPGLHDAMIFLFIFFGITPSLSVSISTSLRGRRANMRKSRRKNFSPSQNENNSTNNNWSARYRSAQYQSNRNPIRIMVILFSLRLVPLSSVLRFNKAFR